MKSFTFALDMNSSAFRFISLNSALHFLLQYDPLLNMTCSNKGDWHLGISREACENVGGVWTRSDCLTLKDCIDNRPEPGTEYFSASFEDFAVTLVIDNAANKDQCGAARQALGFDEDFQFDTEVCDEFKRRECDPFFDAIDDDRKGDDVTFHDISYDPPV